MSGHTHIHTHAHTHTPRYSIRVSLHNGRAFVGPSYNLQNIRATDVTGLEGPWKVLQVRY